MKHRIVDSPIGPLTLVVERGALIALFTAGQRYFWDALGDRDESIVPDAVAQLAEYFAGRRRTFDLPLAARGTPFQHRVWDALAQIPYGETTTYGALASELGSAPRAVGSATGRNPISIIVPCHRLVGASGSLTGYAGGLDRKRWLLDLESGQSLP